jgi:excisionase family DNA binding protein
MKGDMARVGLWELVKDPSQLSEVDPGQIPALLTQLSAVQSSMAARLITATQDTPCAGEDILLSVEEAAERLGVSRDWLYRRTRSLPFVVRVGRHVRFSSAGIDRYVRNRLGR